MKRHSAVVGYALDGFPITGRRGDAGKLLSNADLDSCHGHVGTIVVDGKRVRTYHYHATLEHPYTLGCFHGTPLRLGTGRELTPVAAAAAAALISLVAATRRPPLRRART